MRAYDRDDLMFQLWEVAGLDRLIEGSDLDRAAVMGILDTADHAVPVLIQSPEHLFGIDQILWATQ